MKKSLLIKIVLLSLIAISIALTLIVANGFYQNRQLFKAIESNSIVGAEKAISRGAWINTRKHLLYIPNVAYTNPTPLISACKIGNADIVKLLLIEGADINKKDNFTDETPLLAALHGIKSNRFSLAQYMIEQGADIYAVQEGSNSTLKETLYISKTDDEETINEGFELFQYLIQHQEEIPTYTNIESTLTYAAHYNNYNVVKYLIENEYFDVDSRDPSGDTALIVAVKHERTSIVSLLLELGADLSLEDSVGNTAIDYALEHGHTEIINLLKKTRTQGTNTGDGTVS